MTINVRATTTRTPQEMRAHLDRIAPRSTYGEAFNTWVRGGEQALSSEEWATIRNTMSTTTGSEGGFAVPSLVVARIFNFMKTWSAIRMLATPARTSNGAALSFPTSDGTAEVGELTAQNVTATAADPVFASAAVVPYKFSSKIITVPWELLQDAAADLDPWLDMRLAQRIARAANSYFTTGTGTSQPFGVVTRAASGKVGIAGQTLTIIYDDLVDLMTSVDAAYRATPKCAWMCSDAMLKVLLKVKDTAGAPIVEFEDNDVARTIIAALDAGDELLEKLPPVTPFNVMGYPLWINPDMASPAANAKTLLFGDFSAYVVRDVVAPDLMNMFRMTDSAYTKLGQVGFLMWARSGGNLLDPNAVKYYQHSAT